MFLVSSWNEQNFLIYLSVSCFAVVARPLPRELPGKRLVICFDLAISSENKRSDFDFTSLRNVTNDRKKMIRYFIYELRLFIARIENRRYWNLNSFRKSDDINIEERERR